MLHCGSCLLEVDTLCLSTLQVESVAGSLADALHTAQAAAGSACDAEIQLFEHLVDKAEALLQSPRAGGDGGFCASSCVVLTMGTEAVICNTVRPCTGVTMLVRCAPATASAGCPIVSPSHLLTTPQRLQGPSVAQQPQQALFAAWTRTLMPCLTLMRTFSGLPGSLLVLTGALLPTQSG